tara:strand:- start:15367 stop:15525 length:159 start_codon:yes stop_codon:yes gene_type:complete
MDEEIRQIFYDLIEKEFTLSEISEIADALHELSQNVIEFTDIDDDLETDTLH